MTYAIRGIDPSPYAHLKGLSDEQLAIRGVARMTADTPVGYPCRVTLDDARPGQVMLLVNYVSHEGNNPYRASHAIFITEDASDPARFVDEIPLALDRRLLSLRAFGEDGMMVDAALAQPGDADPIIRMLLANAAVDHIDAHNAIRGCFAARIERS